MRYILTGLFFLWATTRIMAQQTDESQIKNLLSRQVMQWNKGDVEGYMVGYWENDSLVFIGKNGPTYGYLQTLERYKKSYPTPEAMGQLTSMIISLQRLSEAYFFVVGRWELKRKDGDLKGSYTLLLRKIDGKWVIINDHSS
jgi:ketosteroid isomerase-like protein